MLSFSSVTFVLFWFVTTVCVLFRFCFFLFLFLWRCRFFRVFFVPLPFYLCTESTSYVLSFRMVFFYLVTTGRIFNISLCENSTNQSINQSNDLGFPRSNGTLTLTLTTYRIDNRIPGIQYGWSALSAECGPNRVWLPILLVVSLMRKKMFFPFPVRA